MVRGTGNTGRLHARVQKSRTVVEEQSGDGLNKVSMDVIANLHAVEYRLVVASMNFHSPHYNHIRGGLFMEG